VVFGKRRPRARLVFFDPAGNPQIDYTPIAPPDETIDVDVEIATNVAFEAAIGHDDG
jgi:hypothetical protein